MSLSAILEEFNFYKATKETGIEFWKETQRHHNDLEKNNDLEDIRKALQILQKGVSHEDYPGSKTPAADFCEEAFREIITKIKRLDPDESMANGTQAIYEECFDFTIAMFTLGPGSTHLRLLDTLRGYCGGYRRSYYQYIPADKLTILLQTLCREFRSREPDFDSSKYSSLLNTAFHFVVDKKRHPRAINTGRVLEKETYIIAQEAFLEVYIYHELSFLTHKEEVKKRQRILSQMIASDYEQGPFLGIKDPEVFRRHLGRITEVTCEKSFPQNEGNLKIVEEVLKLLLHGILGGNLAGELAHDVWRFVLAVAGTNNSDKMISLLSAVGTFFTQLQGTENVQTLKSKSGLMQALVPDVIQFLGAKGNKAILDVVLIKPVVCNVLCTCMTASKEDVALMIQLLKSLLNTEHPQCIDTAQTVVVSKDKFLKWKSHVEDANELLDIIANSKIEKKSEADTEHIIQFYLAFLDTFLEQLKRDRVIKELNDRMVGYCLKCLQSRSPYLFQLGSEVVTRVEFNIKKEKELLFKALNGMEPLLKDKKFPWTLPTCRNIAQTIATVAMNAIVDSKVLSQSELQSLVRLTETVAERDFIHPDTNTPDTVFFHLYSSVGCRVVKMIDDDDKAKIAAKLFSKVLEFIDSEFRDIESLSIAHIASVSIKVPAALARHMQRMVEVFADTENTDLLYPISRVYPHNKEPLQPRFQVFFNLIDSRDDDVRGLVLKLLQDVAQLQPKLYEEQHICTVIEELESASESEQGEYLRLLHNLARQRPLVLKPHVQTILDTRTHRQAMPLKLSVVKNIAVNSSEEEAEQVVAYYSQLLSEPDMSELSPLVLNELRTVGGVHRLVLEKRKGLIERLKTSSSIQSVKDTCSFILDVLEGRSLEGLSADVHSMKEDFGQMEKTVESTKDSVTVMEKGLTREKKRVDKVEGKVDKHGKEIKKIGKTVDETVEKVEEIDKKTLSHAPFWARDVSKLLNPKDKHDWRLLSSRLGYSNDDIRGWSQTADPCQSMLNEWYTTNKTREATFGVLTALNEMNRADAAIIVENAMKMAETVVEDDIIEYESPPSVFISYQWGHQPEVQLLQRHLESAGYSCWLDVGQMGGGDKLFEKIDRGIRAARVVICCVTEKYAQSPNCNREVNLAANLGKSIIPLLLEKCTWPPPGSMGPLFSEYLFIRMFSRQGEVSREGVYWPDAKFRELLMQLNYNKVDAKLSVEKEYKDWWLKAINTKTSTGVTPDIAEKSSSKGPPEVFISYQWGKQAEVQTLYSRITSLGYTCWMDIRQMGGGDSLFEKIDKGVRGSKVVVSCVTAKYYLSANCKREVTLADALKKPIIPILLEEGAWPPSGSMSMVLTSLKCIDCCRVQDDWKGVQVDELVTRIEQCVKESNSSNEVENKSIDNDKDKPLPRKEVLPKTDNPKASKSCTLL